MTTKSLRVIQLVLIALSIIPIIVLWDKIPDTVPVHFDINGTPNGFAPKAQGVFIFPATTLFMFLLLLVIPRIDPKRKTPEIIYGLSVFSTILVFFFSVLSVVMLLQMTGMVSNGINLVMPIIILMFLIMGNFMGKLRPNYFMGIRTPWTLESEEVWVKTHRLAGYVWVVGSALMLILAFALPKTLFGSVFLTYVAILVVVPVLYSYLVHRQLKSEDKS